jgi:hypothetical protein
VACGNCGANYDASGPDPRCPACNARLSDYEPGEARPAVRGYDSDLEGPDLMRRRDEPPETAPIEEFVAAGLVALALVLIVVAVFAASPVLLNAGLATFAITGVGFGMFKAAKFIKHGRQRRAGSFDDTPSMMDWLIGRGFWDRWR